MRKQILRIGLICDAIAFGLAIYGASNGSWWLTGLASLWWAIDILSLYLLVKEKI